MAFHAKRSLSLQRHKLELSEVNCAELSNTDLPRHFNFDLQPVVSCFTKHLPARRRTKLPFASVGICISGKESGTRKDPEGRNLL